MKARKDAKMKILLGDDTEQKQEIDAIDVPEQVCYLSQKKPPFSLRGFFSTSGLT